MQKIIIPLILIVVLTSCTVDWKDDKDTKITELEKQIQTLKADNTSLQSENMLLKAGGIPGSVQTSGGPQQVEPNSLFPEGSTFEEGNGAKCMKKAQDDYIQAGIKKCQSLGYSDADIHKDKCQLDTSYIKNLQRQKTDAEAACGPQ